MDIYTSKIFHQIHLSSYVSYFLTHSWKTNGVLVFFEYSKPLRKFTYAEGGDSTGYALVQLQVS